MIDIDATLTTMSPAIPAGGSDELPRVASLGDKLRRGSVLVALTSAYDASGAISVAQALQQRYGAAIHTVHVFGRTSSDLPPRVPDGWRLHLDVRRAVDGIVHCADRVDATLVALGLRHQGVGDRVLHDATVLAVAGRVAVPTLVVAPELRGLPRRAVAAVDFGPASVRAAQAALDLIARPVTHRSALLRLAYVDRSPRRAEATTDRGETLVNRLGIKVAFARLIRELAPPPYLRIDSTVLTGAPGQALLDFATDSEADLIAIGHVRRERAGPVPLGSVTRALIRASRFSVLVTPASPYT